ncbi:PREDICTED: F-box/FBD/LRR-repeat protein At1g13570-like [Fragaria vesca subsp. vesca]
MELDRISSLPSDVIENILSHLPIRVAARTSVLSSKWRYQFAKLQHLGFGCLCRSNIVDHVLLNHIGPISKFRLVQGRVDTADIDRWVLHLSRHPLKEFILLIWVFQERRYDIPSCIFSCQDMIHLRLSSCLLKPPSTFKGFRSLKSLAFTNITMAQDVFERLICAPLLERLTLRYCDGFSQLKIDAPNLQFLDVGGSYEDVSIVNMFNVADVSICFSERGTPSSSGSLIKFFDDLPRLQRLQINWNFFKYLLAGGALLDKLPNKPCLHLKYLCLDDLEDISTALCLIRSSPALERLEISAIHDYRWSFTQLRHVKITGFSCVEADLNFISFLLLSSPMLETMTVDARHYQLDVDIEPLDLAKKLLRLKRASTNLEVIYLDK